MPTFANLAGYSIPGDRTIDGIDQTDLLFGKSENGRSSFVYDQINTPSLAIRNSKWKLLVPGRKPEKPGGYLMDFGTDDYELYDLIGDIGETRNVIGQHPEIAGQMKQLLQKHIESSRNEVPSQGIRLPDSGRD